MGKILDVTVHMKEEIKRSVLDGPIKMVQFYEASS